MTTNLDRPRIRSELLRRSGVVVVASGAEQHDDLTLQALELELAALGYLPSGALRERLRTVPARALRAHHRWLLGELSALRGSDQIHTPLFQRFPDGVPTDTFGLWVDRVLTHFFQADDAPCLHCEQVGSTHVLHPCLHVVCDRCFDGSNYSGCPICGAKIDPTTPFLRPPEPRKPGQERVRYQLLRLRDDLESAARELFTSLCVRTQALSPDDTTALQTLLEEYGERVIAWLPETIPVRENIARVFGALVAQCDSEELLGIATGHMTTATDVLRFIAAYSGADPSLQPEERYQETRVEVAPPALLRGLVEAFGGRARARTKSVWMTRKVRRFPVAKLRRSLRRRLLGALESLPADRLCEDMLRHRSYWVWVGEFLHPHEYAKRFPNTAQAFHVMRRRSPDGTKAPPTRTFRARVEAAADAGDPVAMTTTLRERPGEFARRLDHVLRLAVAQGCEEEVLTVAEEVAPQLSTPMLVTLQAHFRTRTAPAPVRIFWPKGGTATGASKKDDRPPLPSAAVERLTTLFVDVLLRRLAEKPSDNPWVVDARLADVTVPFNERTASSAAVALTRGSRVDVPDGKIARLFLHWSEPPLGHTTDLDLSVAFYDAEWRYAGVCSYYQLAFEDVAKSSGDFTSAPFPEGASEFVDIDRERALARGVRYAVMVVNAYSGLPFAKLDRAFAGLMLRDDDQGLHFDPRTVELKFQLTGAHGVFLPLALDLVANRLHWMDVYNRGQFLFNNVATSNRAITQLCPESIAYFAHGSRATMLDLALLHAAARSRRVYVRGDEDVQVFDRAQDEPADTFLHRLRRGDGGRPHDGIPESEAVTAILHRGDVDLAPGSEVYALFRERVAPTMSASDLLS